MMVPKDILSSEAMNIITLHDKSVLGGVIEVSNLLMERSSWNIWVGPI